MATSVARSDELETITGLIAAIRRLPSDPDVPKGNPGYNRYTTQKAHWLGWLGDTPGTGSYERKTPAGQGVRYVYNHIVEPKMLLWLIDAAGVDAAKVGLATQASAEGRTLACKCRAIRKIVSYAMVSSALASKPAP